MRDSKKDDDVEMVDAFPSQFSPVSDINSVLDQLPFVGSQQPVLPPVSKSRFEPKVKARPQARGKGAQPARQQPANNAAAAAAAATSRPASTADPAPRVLSQTAPSVVLKQEPGLEIINELKAEDVKPEPATENGFCGNDTTRTAKEEAGLVSTSGEPKPAVDGSSSVFPEVVAKEEEVWKDARLDDGEDQVVREFDVYLRPSVDKDTKLYLLQYPLRPSWRPYGLEERCEQVRVKPNLAKIELDLLMETEGENYDPDVSAHLKIKKQKLSSSLPHLSTNYAVGIFRGHKLHLNPLHAIVQLRPSMAYLDEADASTKKSVVSDDGDEKMVDAEEPSEETSDLVAMQVTVRKRETERQEEMRLHSYEHLKKMEAQEAWVTLEPHGRESPVTVDVIQKMKSSEGSSISFNMSSTEYLKTLVPGRASSAAVEALTGDGSGNAGLSRSFLDTLPLKERLETVLSKGRVDVLQFDRLMKLAPPGCLEQDILQILEKKAMLVQGCWVARSLLRYKGRPDLTCISRVRDYILLLFTKNRVVTHQQLDEIKVPKEMLREVLLPLAVQRGAAAGWEFQESTDKSFLKRHQAVAKQAAQNWAAAEEEVKRRAMSLNIASMEEARSAGAETVSGVDNTSGVLVSSSGPAGAVRAQRSAVPAPKSTVKDRLAEARGILEAKNAAQGGEAIPRTMSEATVAALPEALKEIFGKHSVCSLLFLRQSLREMAITKSASKSNPKAAAAAVAAADGANAPQKELEAEVSKVAGRIENVYFLASLGNSQIDPFRECVIQLLRTKGTSGGGLRKQDVMEASKLVCKRECPSQTYSKIMKELCYSKGGTWILKPGDGRPT